MSLRDTWAAWLGPTADTITDDQLAHLDAVADALTARGWPDGDPDHAEERTAALNGAVQILLGDDTLEGISAAWRKARQADRECSAAFTGAVLAVKQSSPTVISERVLAERADVARMTVRKALGR